jgi:hypothetical protein
VEKSKEVETIVKYKRGARDKKYKVYAASGYKGVHKRTSGIGKRLWQSHVSLYRPKDGKHITIHVGSFLTPEEANTARIKFITDLL